MKTCTIEGCDKPLLARGMCGMHYRRNRVHGDPTVTLAPGTPKPVKNCSVDGCIRHAVARGLCSPHFQRFRRHGSATAGRAGATLGIPETIVACSADGCESAAKARGMCWSHLNRERYAADPQTWKRYAAEYRARERGAFVEAFTPAEILERDGWLCGLCRKAIPRSAAWPDPQSASIDHIVPLSKGGDHGRANVQAAHLVCNVAKGNRGGGEQLVLVG